MLTLVKSGSSFTDMRVSVGFKGRYEKYILEYILFGSSIKAFHHELKHQQFFLEFLKFHIDNRSYKMLD